MTAPTAATRVRTVAPAMSLSEPHEDLSRMDDDGGVQMLREPVLPGALIPGAREAGMLTTFGTSASSPRIPDGLSTMDAATIAQRQREGGGAPSQRRPARERSSGGVGHTLHQFFTTTRTLFPWRFRTNDV